VGGEGVWRELAVGQLRLELEELTGRPVQLNIYPAPEPEEAPQEAPPREAPGSEGAERPG
jgi:hypothetical protein